MGMTQVPSLSLRSTPLRKFSASRIEDNGVGKPSVQTCSFLETDRCLLFLLLTSGKNAVSQQGLWEGHLGLQE